ncbi:MAG: Uma2 family endonuclease [Acidobacteriota bacterium]|nr:Uma2 family endonuclease [Acidobacteriota bacterium]
MTHLAFINPLLFSPGDRLSREEFLELWEQMPRMKFAELIDGTVYMPSPLSLDHGGRDGQVQLLFGIYAARTRVCKLATNCTWLVLESAPQPDAALWLLPRYGGRTTVVDGLASGAPELIAEICHSSRSYDLGPKLSLYQRAEVPEYIAFLIKERRIEWRILEQGSYRVQNPDHQGILRSRIFPGLWLDENAYWEDDSARMLEVLEAGLRSEEHAEFLRRLRA